MSTHTDATPRSPESTGAAWRDAWESLSKSRTEGIDPADFRLGWQAAMRSIWDRLPAPEYARDPMTPREVERLLNYVRANLPPNAAVSGTSPAATVLSRNSKLTRLSARAAHAKNSRGMPRKASTL